MPVRKDHYLHAPYPLSDHYDGRRFFNPSITIKKSFRHVLKMLKESRGKNKWPKSVKNQTKPQLADKLLMTEAYITYVNHASHLIQLHHLTLLTDPIFSKRAGPYSMLGPKRVREPGILLKNLPPVDFVLISHNHYDHMDLSTLKKLDQLFQPVFLVPLGNRRYLKAKRIERVIEMDWWQTYRVNDLQSITLVPAQHWSRRTLRDTNKALWGGFWMESGSIKIYFAGDTGYGPHFKWIQQKMGQSDISILPIGSYEPRWFMKDMHMNPEEAVLASLDMQSEINIATHHQTFRLSAEGMDDPVLSLKKSLQSHGLREKHFLVPENGETIIYREGK